MLPAYLLPLLLGGFGLIIGSFLNVVAYRVPRGESIVAPRSRCPACSATILPRDNVPLLSWLVLRGHCRSCGVRIPARYVAVEGITGAVFAALAARFGLTADLAVSLALAASLVVAPTIALAALRVPRSVAAVPLLLAGAIAIAFAVAGEWQRPAAAVLGAAVAWSLAAAGRVQAGEREMFLVAGFLLGWSGLETEVVGAGFVMLGLLAGALLRRGSNGKAGMPALDRSRVTMIALSCGAVMAVLLAGTLIPIWGWSRHFS